jgi:Protein of unknown function (DUF3667)
MNGSEFIGDVAQGALLAQAIEPDHGGKNAKLADAEIAPDGHTHESACLNCGTALIGSHCHACGQAAHVHRTLWAIVHDLAHGLFHFEGKVWRTLPMLAWHPGRLTREYIAGRRASYVSPIALFLFVVFLTFAIFGAMSGTPHIQPQLDAANQKKTETASQKLQDKITALEKSRQQAVATHQPTDNLDGQLLSLRTALKAINATHDTGLKIGNSASPVSTQLPNISFKASNPNDTRGAAFAKRMDKAWKDAKANPDLTLLKVNGNAHKYSWLLIPLSLPFVWLLFPFNRRYRLYDHTVFITYSISFMMVLGVVISLASFTKSAYVLTPLLLYAPFHLYRQLREAYELSRLSAIVRAAILALFAVMVMAIWVVLMLGLLLTG